MSFKRTTPTVVLNDTGSPQETTCTVDPLKPNLTRRFLRALRTPYKQTQTQGPKLYSKVLAIEPNRLHNNSDIIFIEETLL